MSATQWHSLMTAGPIKTTRSIPKLMSCFRGRRRRDKGQNHWWWCRLSELSIQNNHLFFQTIQSTEEDLHSPLHCAAPGNYRQVWCIWTKQFKSYFLSWKVLFSRHLLNCPILATRNFTQSLFNYFIILGATIHRLWFTGLLSFKARAEEKGNLSILNPLQFNYFPSQTVQVGGWNILSPVISTRKQPVHGKKLWVSVIL